MRPRNRLNLYTWTAALVFGATIALAGCGDPQARRQAVAESAATDYEAAAAILLWAATIPDAPPMIADAAHAIQINALAIVTAEGYAYTPGSGTVAPIAP